MIAIQTAPVSVRQLFSPTRLARLVRNHWPLLVITLVAAIIRFWEIAKIGFNNDEAVYAGQAAVLAGDAKKAEFFEVFRAHPLLVQFLISLPYRFGVTELAARGVIAALGTLTVTAVYVLGLLLYSRKAATISSLILAILPYHILVSRQVLLDVGVGFFYVLTLIFVVLYAKTSRLLWAYAFGVATGLTVLSKETGILLVPVVLLYLWSRRMLKLKPLIVASAAFIFTFAPYPFSLLLGGGTGRAQFVLTWQLSRPANHTWLFYPVALFPYFDVAAVLAVPGMVFALIKRQSADTLLLLWFIITFLFFQLWPVKGFHYIIPVAPALCLFASRFFDIPWLRISGIRVSSPDLGLRLDRLFSLFLVLLASSSLLLSYDVGGVAAQTSTPLAGLAGLPGGKELGLWITQNVPEGTVFLTLGPTMANLIQFYGERQAYGLSVSSNPIRRNPAYTPIRNPDYQIATGQVQYLVWDFYSATRSQYFSDKLMGYVQKYNGQLVHSITVETPETEKSQLELIRVYRVYGAIGT